MIALLSSLFINGACVPRINFDLMGACLSTTSLNMFLNRSYKLSFYHLNHCINEVVCFQGLAKTFAY